jgi:DNA-binding transcriptional LysR family regulator
MGQDQRYKELQLAQLRSFCLAATERNFTAAARSLGLTAPTVWQQVRALERRLQTTLLRRQGRNVELTTEGRLLLDLVHPHVSGLDSLEALFFSHKSQLGRPLTVAAIPYLTSSYLLEPIREYREARPQVPLKLHVCIWFQDVLRMVERGQADLGVMFYDRDEPRNLNLTYDHLFDLRFVLLMPAGHVLASRKRVHPRELVSESLIVPPEGSFAHKTLNQLLRRYDLGDKVNIIMETPLLDIIKKYVEAGLGVSPAHIGEHEALSKGLVARPLGTVRESVGVCVVHRKGAHLSDPVREFAAMLHRHLAGRRSS